MFDGVLRYWTAATKRNGKIQNIKMFMQQCHWHEATARAKCERNDLGRFQRGSNEQEQNTKCSFTISLYYKLVCYTTELVYTKPKRLIWTDMPRDNRQAFENFGISHRYGATQIVVFVSWIERNGIAMKQGTVHWHVALQDTRFALCWYPNHICLNILVRSSFQLIGKERAFVKLGPHVIERFCFVWRQ